MKRRKKKIMIIIAACLLVVAFAALTTVLVINGTIKIGRNTKFLDDVVFTKANTETGSAEISSDGKSMTFTSIELLDENDEFILDFEVTNKNKDLDADVIIECGGNNTLIDEYLTSIINPSEFILPATESQEGKLTVRLKKVNYNDEFNIEYKCSIHANALESNGSTGDTTIGDSYSPAKPKIDETNKLVPVTLADDGTVTKVSEDDDNWYNYNQKRWANAVILNDDVTQEYNVGDVIPESDIESYFVWIPKYKYRLWNVETMETSEESPVHQIDIIFDTKDTTDIEGSSCKTPLVSGESGNCDNGEYMTHPAFITFNVDGFWVGKFETGYRGATTKEEAEVNESNSSKIIVKPNVYSWRKSTLYNMFTSAYNYERDLDSHMMKNTEWGAVAYLSHSRYGIGKEVNINNNSKYKTGYSALPTTDQSKYPGISGDGEIYNDSYNNPIGYLASTTGNITGVYDMSGGAHEYMASYRNNTLLDSGFTEESILSYNSKYFDIYNENSDTNTFQYRILGDATGEMSPFSYYADSDGTSRQHNLWYSDASHFVDATHPWVDRSGLSGDGVIAGQFYFIRAAGGVYSYITSRLVLIG